MAFSLLQCVALCKILRRQDGAHRPASQGGGREAVPSAWRAAKVPSHGH